MMRLNSLKLIIKYLLSHIMFMDAKRVNNFKNWYGGSSNWIIGQDEKHKTLD